jgi:hypothetical protein
MTRNEHIQSQSWLLVSRLGSPNIGVSVPHIPNDGFAAGISAPSPPGIGRTAPDAPAETGRSAQRIQGRHQVSLINPLLTITSVGFLARWQQK